MNIRLPPLKPILDAAVNGPVVWVRVFTGTALAVSVCLTVAVFLHYFKESDGCLSQSKYLSGWVFSVSAQLVGGGIAGYKANNYIKQGFMVGVLSCPFSLLILLIFAVVQRGLELNGSSIIEKGGYTILSSLALSVSGAWSARLLGTWPFWDTK
jgi:hypothetical protein